MLTCLIVQYIHLLNTSPRGSYILPLWSLGACWSVWCDMFNCVVLWWQPTELGQTFDIAIHYDFILANRINSENEILPRDLSPDLETHSSRYESFNTFPVLHMFFSSRDKLFLEDTDLIDVGIAIAMCKFIRWYMYHILTFCGVHHWTYRWKKINSCALVPQICVTEPG